MLRTVANDIRVERSTVLPCASGKTIVLLRIRQQRALHAPIAQVVPLYAYLSQGALTCALVWRFRL